MTPNMSMGLPLLRVVMGMCLLHCLWDYTFWGNSFRGDRTTCSHMVTCHTGGGQQTRDTSDHTDPFCFQRGGCGDPVSSPRCPERPVPVQQRRRL